MVPILRACRNNDKLTKQVKLALFDFKWTHINISGGECQE